MTARSGRARLVFLHGAGGYVDDGPLARGLGQACGAEVELPRLPDDDMSVAAWAVPVRGALAGLDADDRVVGHSFGATVLLHVLADGLELAAPVTLLAMPDWGPEGWDVAEYVPGRVGAGVPITLHHCRDDEVVEFGHLALAAARLPSARVVAHDRGGHQFEGLAEVIASQ